METASPTAPDNLENYLAKVDSLKLEIKNLEDKIFSLQKERVDLEAGNADAFQSIKDKTIHELKDADAQLKAAKLIKVDNETKKSDLDAQIEAHRLAVASHESEKYSFNKLRENAINTLKSSQADADKKCAENSSMAQWLANHKKELDDKESSLNVISQKQAEKQEYLLNIQQQNKSDHEDNTNAKSQLDAQMNKIHQDIIEYGKQRDSDIAHVQSLANKSSADLTANQSILDEIKQRSERLQELIINQKIMSKDIDGRTAILRAQQDKTNEMIITLKGLKEELSKETPTTEAPK